MLHRQGARYNKSSRSRQTQVSPVRLLVTNIASPSGLLVNQKTSAILIPYLNLEEKPMKRFRSATLILALSMLGLEGCQTKSSSRDNSTAAGTVKPKTAPTATPEAAPVPTPPVMEENSNLPPAEHTAEHTAEHAAEHAAHTDKHTTPSTAHHDEAITEHSTPAIYIFSCGVPTNGSLGGRKGADGICVTHKPAVCTTEAKVHALITVSSNDQISMDKFAGLTKDKVPTALPVVFIKDTAITPLTTNWKAFLDTKGHKKISKVKGKEVVGLEELVEGAILVGDTAFTGTNSCHGWTSSINNEKATVGWNRHKKNEEFKALNSSCSTSTVTEKNQHDKGQEKHLMGVCW